MHLFGSGSSGLGENEMISCDECQKKLVAAFDNEAGKEDEQLISSHLKDCRECRAFYQDMVRLRQQFVSVPMPSLSPAVGQELMRIAQADSLHSSRRGHDESRSRQPLLLRFPRLIWAGGLAAALLCPDQKGYGPKGPVASFSARVGCCSARFGRGARRKATRRRPPERAKSDYGTVPADGGIGPAYRAGISVRNEPSADGKVTDF